MQSLATLKPSQTSTTNISYIAWLPLKLKPFLKTRCADALPTSLPGFLIWCSKKDGQVIGYAYAHLWQERAAYCHTWETTVYISSSSARQGIGRLLMSRLIEECRKSDCYVLIACITHGNESSYALHRKLGFEQVAFFRKSRHQIRKTFGRHRLGVDITPMNPLPNTSILYSISIYLI